MARRVLPVLLVLLVFLQPISDRFLTQLRLLRRLFRMLGDLDLIHMARSERSSFERGDRASFDRSERSSFERSERTSFEQAERSSLDRTTSLGNESTASLRRLSIASEPETSSWSFLGTSPLGTSGSSFKDSFLSSSFTSGSFKEHFLTRHESLPAKRPTDKMPHLLKTFTKGLDQFR